jgi:trimeric autotransporter adhesin
MALALYDRVQQTGTANTTVSFTLSGSVTGYQSFSVVGNGNTTYYGSTDASGNWEVGIGTYSTTGPTLTRTTILSSSNSNSAVTFVGTVTVFVTYPSGKSVNLDGSGNVSALGTIASGIWNGSTIPVAYGGTGVTASSGANSVMLRDANQNVAVNRLNQANTSIAAAGGTTALTAASTYSQTLTGTGAQTYTMPDATTLTTGVAFVFNNNATGTLTLQDYATGSIGTITSGGAVELVLLANSTVGGTWDVHGFLPENVTWGTNALNLGSTVITNGTWNGGTIQPAYGGTGLTTFTATNNALYSTGASTLTAGTLPVAAGGTGATTLTSNGVVYGNGTSAAGITAAGTTGQVLVATTSGAPSWGSVPAASITGTVPIANGGTGQTTAAAAFNALSPMTTTGDLTYEASANTAARLPIGVSGQVLTASGGIPTWATPASGAGTITRTDFTATASQTVFSVTYTVGLIDVYQNGAKLAQADFTATNGTSFTLATGATSGDLIQAEVFSSLNIYSTITSETFNGTGSQTVFTMSAVPANTASLLVAISGVVQDPTTYTVSSTTLTFSTAPPSASGNISVRYLGVASVGTVGSFSGGTTGLTPSSPSTGAVVLAGTLATTNGGTGLTTVGTNGQVLSSNGTSLLWSTINSGASVSNDTSTASNLYPLFAAATTGTPTTIYTSNAKYLYKPSTGDLQASQVIASNGLVLNNTTVSVSYTIASGNNAMSVGPVTVASGQSVTVSSGQRWLVL